MGAINSSELGFDSLFDPFPPLTGNIETGFDSGCSPSDICGLQGTTQPCPPTFKKDRSCDDGGGGGGVYCETPRVSHVSSRNHTVSSRRHIGNQAHHTTPLQVVPQQTETVQEAAVRKVNALNTHRR